jgi:hypothetical protein
MTGTTSATRRTIRSRYDPPLSPHANDPSPPSTQTDALPIIPVEATPNPTARPPGQNNEPKTIKDSQDLDHSTVNASSMDSPSTVSVLQRRGGPMAFTPAGLDETLSPKTSKKRVERPLARDHALRLCQRANELERVNR